MPVFSLAFHLAQKKILANQHKLSNAISEELVRISSDHSDNKL
jgi:hypothetical protein